jgi:hypothetical protein
MKISRSAHRQLEVFFREYFRDDKLNLPEIELYARRGAWLITKIFKIYGITFGRYIFVKPDLTSRSVNRQLYISKELLAHETTHVLQYQKLGWILFFYTYLKGYLRALRQKEKWDFNSRHESYLEIPHEVEARICAAKFVEWTEKPENETGKKQS